MGPNKTILATVADGGSLSVGTYLKGLALVGIQAPANSEFDNFCPSSITFQSAVDGTYGDFKDGAGVEVAIAVAAAKDFFSLDPIDYISMDHVKVRSGVSAAPVTLENTEHTPNDFFPYKETGTVSALTVTDGVIEITLTANIDYIQAGDRIVFDGVVGGINAYLNNTTFYTVRELTGADKFTLDVDASDWTSTAWTSDGDIYNIDRWEGDFAGATYFDLGDTVSFYGDTTAGTVTEALNYLVTQENIAGNNWLFDSTGSSDAEVFAAYDLIENGAGYTADGKAKKLTPFIFKLICRDLG